jgi:hypothetical protein
MTTEYGEFKFVVLENMKAGPLRAFPDVVTDTMNDAKFTFLYQLLDVCATFQISSAGAKRGFNFMNNIKTKSRNKFEGFHVEMLMRIKSYLSDELEFDLDSVYSSGKATKREDKSREGHRAADANNDNTINRGTR